MEDLIPIVSTRLNIDEEIVEKVIRSQFKFVKDVIESGNKESIHLAYLGKFAIKPNRLDYLPKDFDKDIHKSGKEIRTNNPVD